MKERNLSLDAIKGFAILLVMAGHVLVLNQIEDPYVYNMIKAVQMPVFIMISGYLCGFKQPVNRFFQWKSIMLRRACAYLVPFFSWFLLKQWDDLIRGFKNILFQLDRGLWFLMTLFILNLMLYTAQLFAAPFRKKGELWRNGVFLCAIGGFTAILGGQMILGNTFLSPVLTITYLPFFMSGYLAGFYREWLKQHIPAKAVRALAGASAVLFVLLSVRYNYSLNAGIVIQTIAGLSGCFAIFYCFLSTGEGRLKARLAWIGQYTLELYVVHYHFATVLNRGGVDVSIYSAEGLLFVLLSFAAMSGISAALVYFMKRVELMDFLLFGKGITVRKP